MQRIIAHLDMDAFFAAIEERDNARLAGKPVVVGADPGDGHGRGVVSTANYAARKYGIRSALPISTAWRLSQEALARGLPEAVFVSGNYPKYGRVSTAIMNIVRERVPHIEEASVDEAYLDLSFCGSTAAAQKLCRLLKEEIRAKEKLTCSIGIGPNKLIAKIASDKNKPDGLTVVEEDEAEKFLEPMPIRAIPGIGPKTEELLYKKGVKIIKDVKKFSEKELEEMLGKWGRELYKKARGESDSPLEESWEAKSIGEQETFEKDSRDAIFVTSRLQSLCTDVSRRFAMSSFTHFKTVVLTVRFDTFETISRTKTLGEKTGDPKVLYAEALGLLLPFLDARQNPNRRLIRLIGVRIEKLS